MAGELTFGRYVLIDRIASGGMGEVYIGLQRGIGKFSRPIAVKLLLPHLADDPSAVSMFLTEARIAAQMTHTNIAQVYDVGFDHDRYFIAMELVRGISLSKLIAGLRGAGEQLSGSLLAYVGRGLCEGLHSAHEQRGPDGKQLEVVHRDVTPHNILVSVEGAVKLTDFGIARVADADRLSRPGVVMGKLGYLAPEQILGKPIDRRVDLFSAGATLFHLAALEKPFDTPTGSVLDPQRLPTVPLRVCRPDLPRETIDAIEKALAIDREERFATARDFRNAFPAPPPDAVDELGKLVRRIGAAALVELEAKTENASKAELDREMQETVPNRPEARALLSPNDARTLSVASPTEGALPGQPARSRAPLVMLLVLSLAGAGVWVFLNQGRVVPTTFDAGSASGLDASAPAPVVVALQPSDAAPSGLAALPVLPVGLDAGPAAHPAQVPGFLTVDATPWGEVSVDGRAVGQTPLADYLVTPGRHMLAVRNPETGKTVRKPFVVVSGRTTALKVDLR